MAFSMNYNDDDTSATYSQSYWMPAVLTLNKQEKTGTVAFFGFASEDARMDGKDRIAVKHYTVTPDNYDTYFGAEAQNPEGVNPYASAYQLASATLEDATGLSFFNGATEV